VKLIHEPRPTMFLLTSGVGFLIGISDPEKYKYI